MKRRAIAALLALVMALSLLPATALAAEENTPEPQAEIEYEVTKDTYQTTLETIKEDHTQGSKITLILTEDLELSSNNYRLPITLGLENYSITYRSKEGAGPHSIGGKGASPRFDSANRHARCHGRSACDILHYHAVCLTTSRKVRSHRHRQCIQCASREGRAIFVAWRCGQSGRRGHCAHRRAIF